MQNFLFSFAFGGGGRKKDEMLPFSLAVSLPSSQSVHGPTWTVKNVSVKDDIGVLEVVTDCYVNIAI